VIQSDSDWNTRFTRILRWADGPDSATALTAMPPAYTALTPPGLAARDVLRLGALTEDNPTAVDLWRDPRQSPAGAHRLQVYSLSGMELDRILPLLQNLHLRVLDQMAFEFLLDGRACQIRSFSVLPACQEAPLLNRKKLLLETLTALLRGAIENDALNALSILAGLPWQDIDVLRAYRNHYFQWNPRCSAERFHQALLREPAVTRLLLGYFEARFQPDTNLPSAASREEELLPAIRQELVAALAKVNDSGADRILRDLFNLIDATLRTNHYLHRDGPDRYIALKIDSMGVFSMASPKPRFEIYVHAPHMEGIHLRGSKVARGGIRWSDRPDDFREEILGLMQTQTIKNALIVPHGAKGGFISKAPPSLRRQEARQQAEAAYRTLIRALLELTDNRTQSGVKSLPGVIAYDDDDPYLVVAADKGTARFSDIANAVAAEYGFWLGDAFASGGSHGYDHKRLGITARGAWECVKGHFADLGRDPQTQPLTVVGVGSMDGDVFGNGMLLSRQIRLLGAFGSRHIFLDPNPDAQRSFAERQRLFGLDGSTWTDYDPALISTGGGVYERSAKEITLSPEVCQWLGVRRTTVDGEELIRLLLTAPVDLLWLGGIGTYVKASGEKHEDVGDRGNDGVRVDAGQLRAKVVGEGANLGFTQLARIEFALAGGRLNSDAVDNSAGVDLSDHEVNLKILLTHPSSAPTNLAERDGWLNRVCDEVCLAVLSHNGEQSLAISLDLERSRRDLEPFLETADYLARVGLLDRRSCSFPGRKDVMAREGRRLTRPDLAMLMPSSKLAIKQVLLEHESFLIPWTHDTLYRAYFPSPLRERFADRLPHHPLAREIAAAQIANWIVGRAGSAFPAWCEPLESEALLEAIAAYLVFDRGFAFEPVRRKIRQAPAGLRADSRFPLLIAIEDVIAQTFHWFRRRSPAAIWEPELAGRWQAGLASFLQFVESAPGAQNLHLPAPLPAESLAGLDLTVQETRLLSMLPALGDLPALIELSVKSGAPVARAARVYFRLARELGLDRLLAQLQIKAQGDLWEHRTRVAAAFRLRSNLLRLCLGRLTTESPGADDFSAPVGRKPEWDRFGGRCRELLASRSVTLVAICAIALDFEDLLDEGQRA
jgi:glutamate dehydrogenase